MDNTINSLSDLFNIYLANDDLDDDYMYWLKYKIRKLKPLYQHVLLQYVECNSLRKTAITLNCSQTTVSNIIKKIKQEIL